MVGMEQSAQKLTRFLALILSAFIVPSAGVADDPRIACRDTTSTDTGQPIFFQRRNLVWGLSTKPATQGQKLPVLLWIYNPSEERRSVFTCGDIGHFWEREIEVLDSTGKRVLSRSEVRLIEEHQRDPSILLSTNFECFRNFAIEVPPHACLHGSFSSPGDDFTLDLTQLYQLGTGQYSLVSLKKEEPERVSQMSSGQEFKLIVVIIP